jgi:SAM-dependent methyltransferase
MSFSKEWDERYKANTHLSIWPWSDLVSYVMRYSRPTDSDYSVLELGCGAGANIPFFNSLNVRYFAVEGSLTIVEKLWRRFPELRENIVVGDFAKEIPFSGQFDLVIDRASLTSNSTEAIKFSLALVYEKLKLGGKFIGIDWYSTAHSDYKLGDLIDSFTRDNINEGQFKDIGAVHFSDKAHLLDLFSLFNIETMEHKIIQREIPEDKHIFASWNLVAKKTTK